MSHNQELSPWSMRFLDSLKKLKKLDVSNCPLKGSLEPLGKLSELEELNISNTNLSEGLEHLPKSCKKLYCDSYNRYSSIAIKEKLEKSRCSKKDEEGDDKYYDLNE